MNLVLPVAQLHGPVDEAAQVGGQLAGAATTSKQVGQIPADYSQGPSERPSLMVNVPLLTNGLSVTLRVNLPQGGPLAAWRSQSEREAVFGSPGAGLSHVRGARHTDRTHPPRKATSPGHIQEIGRAHV